MNAHTREISIQNENHYSYKESIRNAVVIEMLFATDARVSEIADLKENDVDLKTGIIFIKGKGNKERLIQVCNKDTLDLLVKYRRLFEKEIHTGNYFLINRENHKLTDQSNRTIVKNLSKLSGIQKNVTPHVFRHTFATLLLEKDVDLKYIQSFLGHSNIATTQIYTHVNAEKQRRIFESKHPRQDLSFSLKKG